MTVNEAAKTLKISPARVRHFIGKGRLKATQHGPMWIIEPSDLSSFQRIKRPTGKHLEKSKNNKD